MLPGAQAGISRRLKMKAVVFLSESCEGVNVCITQWHGERPVSMPTSFLSLRARPSVLPEGGTAPVREPAYFASTRWKHAMDAGAQLTPSLLFHLGQG